MTKPSNLSSIETATGKIWTEWVQWLNEAGAGDMAHSEIATLVHGALEGKVDSSGWWAQGVTVAYEQHIGRRAPGQRNDGSYEVSVTKLIPGSRQDVFALWMEAYDHTTEFDGKTVENIRTRITPVRSYWRCDFMDGSRLSIAAEQRTPGKAQLSATHTKLYSAEEKDDWRKFWRQVLDRL
jgi:hypothetical protein